MGNRQWTPGEERELLFLLIPPLHLYGDFDERRNEHRHSPHSAGLYFPGDRDRGFGLGLDEKQSSLDLRVLLLLIFQAISVTRAYPAYIGYANEAFGGPTNTWRFLSDSSADWAQQLHAVKRYTDEHNIHECWFVYFGTGVIDYDYYNIPCKLLPTVESIWLGTLSDATPAIDGPVFISAVNLTGFEFGPPPLNPYEQFKTLKPAAVIDSSVFMYDGHFEIPLAAALAHAQKADVFLAEKKLPRSVCKKPNSPLLSPPIPPA